MISGMCARAALQSIPYGLLLLVLALCAVPAIAEAQLFVPTGRHTLRQLTGVEVLIETLQPEVEEGGLTQAVIRGAITQRLRARGIEVFASQAENSTLSKPYLYVHVNVLGLTDGGAVAAVQVQVRQTVRSLVTESSIVDAVTWDAHGLVPVSPRRLPDVRNEILRYVDRFIRDWLSVH